MTKRISYPLHTLRGLQVNENTLFIDNTSANIGINTTSPSFPLDVNGTLHAIDIEITGNIYQNGVLFSGGGDLWTSFENDIAYTTGNVGIGTTSPSHALHVIGNIFASGNVIAFSDARFKTNVTTIQSALSKTLQLRGVHYTSILNDQQNIGVIAQEIETVIPEVVTTDNNGYKSVAYGNIVGLLIEAVKDMSAKHEADIAALQSEISFLKSKSPP
jgi:hypothetical protein